MEAPVVHAQLIQELKHGAHAPVGQLHFVQAGILPWPQLHLPMRLGMFLEQEQKHSAEEQCLSLQTGCVLEGAAGSILCVPDSIDAFLAYRRVSVCCDVMAAHMSGRGFVRIKWVREAHVHAQLYVLVTSADDLLQSKVDLRQMQFTFVPDPKGSEPSPRMVCQNATLKRSLHCKRDRYLRKVLNLMFCLSSFVLNADMCIIQSERMTCKRSSNLPFLHGLAHDDFVSVVVVERQRIGRLGALIFNLADSWEEFALIQAP